MARPGTDSPVRRDPDEGRAPAGDQGAQRLQVRPRRVGATEVDASASSTEALDRALLGRARRASWPRPTQAFAAYDYTTRARGHRAVLLDLLRRLRRAGQGAGLRRPGARRPTASARAALAMALLVQLRLFAPFLPYVTEEVWSWWQDGSVHLQAWPTAEDLGERRHGRPEPRSTRSLPSSSACAAPSPTAKVGMRTPVEHATVPGPAPALAAVRAAERDLRAVGLDHRLARPGRGRRRGQRVRRARRAAPEGLSRVAGWPAATSDARARCAVPVAVGRAVARRSTGAPAQVRVGPPVVAGLVARRGPGPVVRGLVATPAVRAVPTRGARSACDVSLAVRLVLRGHQAGGAARAVARRECPVVCPVEVPGPTTVVLPAAVTGVSGPAALGRAVAGGRRSRSPMPIPAACAGAEAGFEAGFEARLRRRGLAPTTSRASSCSVPRGVVTDARRRRGRRRGVRERGEHQRGALLGDGRASRLRRWSETCRTGEGLPDARCRRWSGQASTCCWATMSRITAGVVRPVARIRAAVQHTSTNPIRGRRCSPLTMTFHPKPLETGVPYIRLGEKNTVKSPRV